MTTDDRLDRVIVLLERLAASRGGPSDDGGPTLRLDNCGDWLDIRQYSAWRGESRSTVYAQVAKATCFVMPATLKPLRWRRSDCEQRMAQADLIRDRHQRDRLRARLVKA